MSEKLDFIGGGLMNIILGALILWVGQTTFQHAGLLASTDEKFYAVNQQFADVDKSQESLRRWLEKVVNGIKDEDRTKFTTEDAEKLVEQLRRLDTFASQVERRLTDRLTAVEVKLASVETRDLDGQQLATLQMEVAQLRSALAGSNPYGAAEPQYQPAANMAQGMPVYLPPVNTRR
jgi:uncharacterized protein (DUF885 family)